MFNNARKDIRKRCENDSPLSNKTGGTFITNKSFITQKSNLDNYSVGAASNKAGKGVEPFTTRSSNTQKGYMNKT
jgi:hypothetical protein